MSLLAAMAIAVGTHISSVHLPQREGQNNSNPGIYVRTDAWVVGAYRNTYRRTTVYAAAVVPLGQGFDLVAGGATGYQKKCHEVLVVGEAQINSITREGVTFTSKGRRLSREQRCEGFARGAITPLAAITYAAPIQFLGAQPRVWASPPLRKHSGVIHLSLEWSIK